MITRRVHTVRSICLLWILAAGLFSGLRLASIAADKAQEANAPPPADSSLPTSISGTDDHGEKSPAKPPAAIIKNSPTSVADLQAIQAGIQQAVEKGLPATVGVSIGGSFGSGVIVTEDGYVLTAGHVVSVPDHDATVIFPDGKKVKAKTLGVNRVMDSGMLKITEPGKYPHVELGHSSDLKLGQWCITLGHPGGIVKDRPPVVRAGRVLYSRDDAIGTDCTIVGGDSGGPLLDTAGRLIGIHSRISDDVTENYHVPIDTFRDTWDRLAKGEAWGGPPPPGGPLLGINGQQVVESGNTGVSGCKVTDVFSRTPASKAGLIRDDVITSLDGEDVTGLDRLQTLIGKHKAGDEVTLAIVRNGEKRDLTVKLGRRE